MPKRSKYPGLRSHSWKTAGGQVRTAYYFDRRAEGKPDEPLGTDYAEALRRWHELKFDMPREAGTLNEAFKRWAAEVLPNHKPVTRRTTKRGRCCWAKLMPNADLSGRTRSA